MHPVPEPARILFLFSDTGGGHRSAAEAIIEALRLEYGNRISTEMVDIFLEVAPPPLDHLPGLYPKLVRLPRAWEIGYRLSDGDRRANLLASSAWPYIRKSVHRLIARHSCDMIVSVHPMANAPLMRALNHQHIPFITVVTDLVTTHAFWYHPEVDLCLVPARRLIRRSFGMHLSVCGAGFPVANRFCQPGMIQPYYGKFGWPRPLIIAGRWRRGMGPIERTAREISANCPSIGLVVITGRNQELKERLEKIAWQIPTFIYGFVTEMPDFMRASDILVTKAGPGTISEALIANIPMILYSRLPGQEDGNVEYIVSEQAGVWAPQPRKIVAALQD
jgi:1,2-diacylglycerol 3-beta-galactosyltransferase